MNFTNEELLQFNEKMLQRGVPNVEDGVGYNKADYGACSSYFYGLSDAQLADLANRLVKYCNTQLGVDKRTMEETAKELMKLANPSDRTNGISVEVRDNGVLISFRYNEKFIEIIKQQPKRQWDSENKNWIVPLSEVIPTLNALWTIGADVENALKYVMNNDIYLDWLDKQFESEKIEVLIKDDGDYTLVKFEYNQILVDEIKQIDHSKRKWNPQFKFWAIQRESFKAFKDKFADVVVFKAI
ncbi:MAG: hypothetical protein ABS939_08375 [Psychrobacillus sp.]